MIDKIKKFFRPALPPKDQHVWVVVFVPRESNDFWTLFTWHRPGFDHCFAIRYDKYCGQWLLNDWSSHGLYSEVLPKNDLDNIIRNCVHGNWSALKYKSQAYNSIPLLAFFCVTAVKHLVGIKTWAVTPYQLHCALKKDGAESIFDIKDKPEGEN